jgi:hypothetical protein
MRTLRAKGSESSGLLDLQSRSIPTGFPLKRGSKKALMSTESQTNLLWKDGSQRDHSPEWTFRRSSSTETRPRFDPHLPLRMLMEIFISGRP